MTHEIVTPFQPELPEEGYFSEAEHSFLEESPPGLFPENQDSNFGFIIRKLWTDRVQIAIDQLQTVWNERFVETSNVHLDMWEEEVGLPVAPAGFTVFERRTLVLSRLLKGAFTIKLRYQIVRDHIYATSGTVIQLIQDGVALVAGGIEIWDEPQVSLADVGQPITSSGLPLTVDGIPLLGGEFLFNIVESVGTFSYDVRISTLISPDLVSLQRELDRITPAHISYTITITDNLF